MSEQLVALQARKNAMTSYTDDLFLGAQEAYSALWPGQMTPTEPVGLGNDLQLAKVRLREWRDSGARVGADEALTYFLSWYEKADLETLRTVREGSIWTMDPEHIKRRQELAHSYVDYANTDAFVRDIREPEKKDDAGTSAAAAAEGSDSSQDEEETEEADTDAPEHGSVPGGGDGSIPSAGSGTPEADTSTATAPPAGGTASAPAP
jgi:hypothetical protein